MPSSNLTRILPLAAGTFAIGTGHLVIQGILPKMARDLGVSIGTAGQLVTVFAVTYAASTPLLSTFGARFDRRRPLVTALFLFTLPNLAAALSSSVTLLVVQLALAVDKGARELGVDGGSAAFPETGRPLDRPVA